MQNTSLELKTILKIVLNYVYIVDFKLTVYLYSIYKCIYKKNI